MKQVIALVLSLICLVICISHDHGKIITTQNGTKYILNETTCTLIKEGAR